ncbi:MAG TPA: multiheme c-type cytochrome [Candidatus Cryosericum sp.]|nr:multiheme c-type cytochrome [Candidatus Cryosericum sp.]
MERAGIPFVAAAWACLAVMASPNARAVDPDPDYTGSGSCSSSQCHGSLRPRTDGRVPQNEHTVWVTKDEHAQAYAHLLQERSRTIARNLGLKGGAEKEPRCLACHTVDAPQERRGRSFDVADGVTCEGCHGPAERWLGPHTTRGWEHRQSLELGMRDTKDPLVRAETCSGCHVGTAKAQVDHALLAAGHPELVFEMQWATNSMPPHWREPAARGPFFATRLWAVGEAVHLRDQMSRAARREPGARPEFADLDCGSCHHELVQKSWRQARGYAGRRAGDPPFDLSRWRVLAPLARRAAPSIAKEIDAAAAELAASPADPRGPASRLSGAADQLARKLGEPAADFGRETTLAILADLAGDASPAREFGFRGAGQTAMAIDSLGRALIEAGGRSGPALDASVEALFDTLKNPAAYDPDAFAGALRSVASRLKETAP